MKDFLSQAAKLLKERKQYRRRVAVFLCLAVIVGYGTVAALKLYGQAMTHKAEVLDCEYKVHEHTDECYEQDEEGNLGTEPVCGYADYVIHVHNDSCYNKNGSLVCSLEEHKPHEHTEECYMTERILVCGNETEDDAAGEGSNEGLQAAPGSSEAAAGETPGEGTGSAETSGNAENTGKTAESAAETKDGEESRQEDTVCGEETHKHDENCYENVLNCGYTEEHVHTADCISHELVCEEPEHTHVEECYDADGNLTCGMEEHSHEIGCYDEEGNTLCNTEDHIHDESCLNAEGKIACGPEGHEHITGCYRNYYSCDKEAHTHGDSCYIQTQVCETEEHEHTDECYTLTEEGTAGTEENTESRERGAEEGDDPEGTEEPSADGNGGHIHTDACYQEVKILICGEEEFHIHEDSCYTEECFDEEGNLIEGSRPSCGLLQLEEHIHKGDCFKTVELTPEEVAALNNGAKLHIHEDSCYDEEGKLVCGHDATHIHELECYDDAGKLICGFGEEEKKEYHCGKEEHTHGEECFDAEGNLTCEQDEHIHDETCLVENVYICGEEEHTHGEGCYDAEGNLSCEKEEHTHDESCLEKKVYLCGKEEHTHGEECFDTEENLTCKKEEHTHDETCLEEQTYFCGKVEHTHGEECCDTEGNLNCDKEEHTHDETCLEESLYICGEKKHTHSEKCYDAEGNLTCDQEEHTHEAACLEAKVREEVEKVNQLIAGLPSEEEIIQKIAEYEEAGEEEEEACAEYTEALIMQIQEACDAYLGLNKVLQEYVTGSDYLRMLAEMMGVSLLDEEPANPTGVPSYAAFLPIGKQGEKPSGMVLELLYGDGESHDQKPERTEEEDGKTIELQEGEKPNYTTSEMKGNFKLYTSNILGNTNIGDITLSLYFPKEYMDPKKINIGEFPQDQVKHQISQVTEESRDGKDYYKISITLEDYIPTGALTISFDMKFKVAEVPADYELKIFGILETGEGDEKKESNPTAENIYRPKYEKPKITKYVNTNKYENMSQDGTRVTAKVENGILQSDQYVSFWYKLGDNHLFLRAYDTITLRDTLPIYEDYNGNMQYAVFDPQANPGWEVDLATDSDGHTVKRVFKVEPDSDWTPDIYDNKLMLQIEQAELKLQFPGCKIDEEGADGFLTKDLTNHVEAECEPVNPVNEQADRCQDDIIFTLTNQPGAEGSFTKGNSADTVMDTYVTRSGAYRWSLAFQNKSTSTLVNVEVGDDVIDDRLKFQSIVVKAELLNCIDTVEVFTYDSGGGTGEATPEETSVEAVPGDSEEVSGDIYTVADFENTGSLSLYQLTIDNSYTLTLNPEKEYKSFLIHFKDGYEVAPGGKIEVWPFSTFRNPGQKHFVTGEENDLKNIYKNHAYTAYQEKGYTGPYDKYYFLKCENQFKLIENRESVWLRKEMYYGDNLVYPKKMENGKLDYNSVKAHTFAQLYVEGSLDEDKDYDDLRIIDLLPDSLEVLLSGEGKLLLANSYGNRYIKDFQIIENYHNSGRTALIIYLNVDEVRKTLDASKEDGSTSVYIGPKLGVKPNATPGTYVNDAYLVSKDFDDPPTGHGQQADSLNIQGKGTDAQIRWDQASGSIQSIAGIYARKYIAKENSNAWSMDALRLKVGDNFQYKLSMMNLLETPHTNLVVYDVLPKIGDRSVNNQADRGSEFTVNLRGPITPPTGYQVYYTSSDRVYSEDMVELVSAEIWIQNVEDWTQADWNKITAFKFVANEGVEFGDQQIDFTIPVKVMDALTPESEAKLNGKEAQDRDTGTAIYLEAINSFGYSTDSYSGQNIESNYVKAQISFAGFVVKKTDEKGTVLPGAEFKLEKQKVSEAVPLNGETGTESGSTQSEEENVDVQVPGDTDQTPGDTTQTQEWEQIGTIVTSDSEGKVYFKNLTVGTYRLTETKAPDGYKALTDAITVIITLDEATMEYRVMATGLEGSGTNKNPFVVVNEAFYKLPETGGIGSVLYTMAGTAFIMLGAGVLYKKKFRERRV